MDVGRKKADVLGFTEMLNGARVGPGVVGSRA